MYFYEFKPHKHIAKVLLYNLYTVLLGLTSPWIVEKKKFCVKPKIHVDYSDDMLFNSLGHVQCLSLSLEENANFDQNLMNLISNCNSCRILNFIGETAKNLTSLEMSIMWDIPCHCGEIENTLNKMFKNVSQTLQEFSLSQQILNYPLFKALTKNCKNLRKCLIHLNGKNGYEDDYIWEIAMDLNDPNMCPKIVCEKTEIKIFLTRQNEG